MHPLARPLPLDNYRMSERSLHGDFGIRDERSALPNAAPHRHEYFQIHVQLQGATEHFIGDARRPVDAGTVCFILPFTTHYIPTVPGSRYFIVNASLGYLLPSLEVDLQDLAHTPMERAPELAPFLFQEHIDFVLPPAEAAQVAELCRAMAAEDAQRATGATILIRGYLLQIIGLVWRRHGESLMQWASAPATSLGRHPTLVRLQAYLKERLHLPVSLAEAAAAIHLSPTYLAHLIKRETGQTFLECLTQRRLALARELLQHTSLSVKEIAFRCGYADEAYFGKRFRRLTGKSPSAMRSELRSASTV
jgi:AraC-like DNA-binding protein